MPIPSTITLLTSASSLTCSHPHIPDAQPAPNVLPAGAAWPLHSAVRQQQAHGQPAVSAPQAGGLRTAAAAAAAGRPRAGGWHDQQQQRCGWPPCKAYLQRIVGMLQLQVLTDSATSCMSLLLPRLLLLLPAHYPMLSYHQAFALMTWPALAATRTWKTAWTLRMSRRAQAWHPA